MSGKADGSVRVGCGQYDWSFQDEEPNFVDRLVIRIDLMKVLPADALDSVMTWLAGLPYPWCPAPTAIEAFPKLPALGAVRDFLAPT